jgi:two-component system, NarL family, sensor kinase
MQEIMPPDVAKPCGEAFEQVLSTGMPARVEYSLPKNGEPRFYETRIVRCRDRKLLSIARDISELKRAEIELQQLSRQLMTLQDDERRRIARELHDTTAQHLFAITINIENLKRLGTGISRQGVELLNECRNLCESSLKEVRTLSYLRHPPQLEDTSLVSALRWYVDGFRRRTGIAVDFQPDPELQKLPTEMEVDIFRVVQEGLFKVFRNSGGRSATIILESNEGHVFLEIKHSGHWAKDQVTVPNTDPESEVEVNSIRDRLQRWGGYLQIKSNNDGALLVAEIPISTATAKVRIS